MNFKGENKIKFVTPCCMVKLLGIIGRSRAAYCAKCDKHYKVSNA